MGLWGGRFFCHVENTIILIYRHYATLQQFLVSGLIIAHDAACLLLQSISSEALQAKVQHVIACNDEHIIVQFQFVDGETQTTSYDTFDYFRFYPTPIPTGVVAPEAKIGQQNSIYSLTGVKQETRDNLPAGIYIMKVNENGKKNIKKILKK